MKRILILAVFLLPHFIFSQSPPKEEFRAVWVATVLNLDWPANVSTPVADQKSDLIEILDYSKNIGLNAIIFQVRPACDAFYQSDIEPWSYWFTGEQGKAPAPLYDPLEFAVEEAHKRGLELHAWFNPYRVSRGDYSLAANHVANLHPDWVINFSKKSSFSSILPKDPEWDLMMNKGENPILDPGKQLVRDYVVKVILDVVNRYDVDAIHMDDYFYPYGGMSGEDATTYASEARGFTNIADWRRDNVNLLISSINDSIHTVKPWVKFGMSPFGIWKNGVPTGIIGTSAYDAIYCDAVTWLNDKSVDYLAPQLYWAFEGGQDYGKLLPWWAAQAKSNNRQVYSGLALYKYSDWSQLEIPNQIKLNHQTDGADGHIHFRYGNLADNIQGINAFFEGYYYKNPAVTPTMSWLDNISPLAPTDLHVTTLAKSSKLVWNKASYDSAEDTAYQWIIYAADGVAIDPDNPDQIVDIINSDMTEYAVSNTSLNYAVAALDRLSNESSPAILNVTSVVEQEKASEFLLIRNYPNPFNPVVTISWELFKANDVTLEILNINGKVLEKISQSAGSGFNKYRWNAQDYSSGLYLYRLTAGKHQIIRKMTLLK